MKTAAVFALLATSAAAFAPAKAPATSSALASEKEGLLVIKEKVPCFGATPLWTPDQPVFIGENYWDKLTTEYGSEATGTFLRAAELKHGRSAMIATVGYAFHKFGWTLDNISPHEYLSVTEGVKFADLAAMTPLEAMKNVPAEGITQMFCAIALVELYELTHKDGKWAMEEGGVAPGLQPGGLTGDLGWNPLGIKVSERRRLSELQNGRAAMFAICAWVAADAVQGSVPLNLPW